MRGLVVVMVGIALAACVTVPALADMKVNLKNGRTIDVPARAEDVASITFSDTALPSGDITWDFETGDLTGWETTGDAFNYQPTYGDNPTARHRGQPSHHQGNYWIGGYEKCQSQSDQPGTVQGDGPQGTMTSSPFTVRSQYISFLVGGGCDMNTERVEVLVNGSVVHKVTGKCTETMERVRLNMSKFKGRSAQIRLVDTSSGGWGHINFDDVNFE